jgi:hypothetical protein
VTHDCYADGGSDVPVRPSEVRVHAGAAGLPMVLFVRWFMVLEILPNCIVLRDRTWMLG